MSKKIFFKIYPFIFWSLLIGFLIFLYWQSFSLYFSGDDFFNFSLIKVNGLKEIIHFFNPIKSPKNFPFYRPFSTQFFYWLGKRVFGINPLGFHLINFSFFTFSLFLVYVFIKKLTNNLIISYLTVFFYSFSSSHFYRLYYLSQFQEISLAVFYLTSIIFYLKFINNGRKIYYIISFFTFIFAIFSKETAIVLPLTMFLVEFLFFRKKNDFLLWLKKKIKIFLPFLIILFAYLFFRFFFFGFSKGPEYQFILSPKSVVNNLIWYFLWSVGIPEAFVNISLYNSTYFYNPRFLTEFGLDGTMTNVLFFIFLGFLILAIKLFWQKVNKEKLLLIFFSILWFIITVSLVMFFPFHKFSYSLTLPLIGVSLLLAVLVKELINFSNLFFSLSLVFFILANNISRNFAFKSHWTVARSNIAKKVFLYFKKNYPQLSNKTKIYFLDYNYCIPDKKAPLSRELAYALNNDKALNLFYNKKIKVYYQSQISIEEIGIKDVILIFSENFFNSKKSKID